MVDPIPYSTYNMLLQFQCWFLHFSYSVLQYLSSAAGNEAPQFFLSPKTLHVVGAVHILKHQKSLDIWLLNA